MLKSKNCFWCGSIKIAGNRRGTDSFSDPMYCTLVVCFSFPLGPSFVLLTLLAINIFKKNKKKNQQSRH